MHITALSDPAIPGADEDAAGTLGDVAVVLDGAGIPPRFRAGCHHAVAWYSHALAARLLARAQDPQLPLAEALAAAIAEVAALHEDECDLPAGSPSATVVAVRCGAEHLEHLVLCDSSLLLLGAEGEVTRITDRRVDEAARTAADGEELESLRNAEGGFWVARHEPEAAARALVGRTPLAQLAGAHLVSDGITRAVDLLGLHDDASLARALSADPRDLLRRLRNAEADLPPERRPRKLHDDATVLTTRWGNPHSTCGDTGRPSVYSQGIPS